MAVEPPADYGESDTTLGVSAFVVVLVVVSVVCRIYTRLFTRAGLWWDDWLIIVAVVITLLTSGLVLWANSVDPNGQWVADNTDPDYVYTAEDSFYLKLTFIASVLYFAIAATSKLGILAMYHRLFSINRSYRYQLLAVGVLVIAWWVGCTVATLTNCIPLKWTWVNGLADPRYCFNFNVFWMATGACEVLLDMVILALPVRAVMNLQLTLRKKITVAGIFLLGGFVVITGIVRTILGYAPHSRVPSYSKTEVWATVHAGIMMLCANLPVLRPLIGRIKGLQWLTSVSSVLSSRRSRRESQVPISVSPETVRSSTAFSTQTTDKDVTITISTQLEKRPTDQLVSVGSNWTDYEPAGDTMIAEEIAGTLTREYGMDIETQRRRSQLTSFVFVPTSTNVEQDALMK